MNKHEESRTFSFCDISFDFDLRRCCTFHVSHNFLPISLMLPSILTTCVHFPYDFRLFYSVFCCISAFITSTYGYKQCISDFVFVFLSLYLFSLSLSLPFWYLAIQLIQCFLFPGRHTHRAVAGLFFIRRILWKLGSPMIYLRFGNMYYDCSALEPYSHRAKDIAILLQQHTTDMIIFFMFLLIFYSSPFHKLSFHCFSLSPFDEFQFFFSSVVKFGYKNWWKFLYEPTNQQS